MSGDNLTTILEVLFDHSHSFILLGSRTAEERRSTLSSYPLYCRLEEIVNELAKRDSYAPGMKFPVDVRVGSAAVTSVE
ncbi:MULTISPECIES: hypothetical protein [unclassified Streptomyces]|uniref:hypothetical protein n=1 Tax=unclassified Streptomyces TaxID=2593676 RepID=UPI00381A0EC3